MRKIRTANYWLINLALAAAYFLLGIFCSRVSGNTLIVPIPFLPEGVALAAALVYGRRCAYGVFVGQVALALINGAPVMGAIGIALVNAIEVVVAVTLAQRWKIDLVSERFAAYVKFLLMVMVILQPFSAFGSNAVLWLLGGITNPDVMVRSIATWWASNVLGQVLLVPGLVHYFSNRRKIKRITAFDLLISLVLPVVTFLLFYFIRKDLALIIAVLLPLLLLTAYRCQIVLFGVSATLTAVIASVATSYDIGPFAHYGSGSYEHLNVLFFGTILPAQIISMLFRELKLEQKQVLGLSEERVRLLTYFDPLTGLPNRMLAESLLLSTMEDCGTRHQDCAVVLADLDDFRLVNEAYGQVVGDEVLKQTAERIKRNLKADEHLCRIGGDEFLLILPDVKSRSALDDQIEKLMSDLRATLMEESKAINLLVTCGVVTIRPNECGKPELAIRYAEAALNNAKREGGNRYRHYNPQLQESAAYFSTLAEGLRFALERKELSIFYQPQYDLKSGKIAGAEALLRWRLPGLGVLSPTTFIAIAERSGLIVPIGEWVIRSVCQQMVQWRQKGLPDLSVSINVSSVQIHRSDIGETIQQILTETGVDSRLFSFEVTESMMLQEDEAVDRFLNKVEAVGASLAIDDFGTGFSNLAYLRRLNIARLKIDKLFVHTMIQSETDRNIVKSVIDLAQSLNAIAVAEGVEDQATVNILKDLGCELAQGYFFARPMGAIEFEESLRIGDPVVLEKRLNPAMPVSSKADPRFNIPEEKFKLLFECAPVGMAMVDHATGRFKEVNQTLLMWTGYTRDELLKLSFWDITPKEYEAQEFAQIDQLNQDGCFGPSFKEYIRKDGTRFPIRLRGFKAVDSEGTPVVWGLVDSLEAPHEKPNPSASMAGLDSLNLLFDAICMVDESGRFVFVSQAAERIFGYAPEEMIGRNMIDFVYEADREQTLGTAEQVMSGTFVKHFENRYRRKDGRIVNVLWSARWSDADRLRIAVARDITERKQNEVRISALYHISEAANEAVDLDAFFKQLNRILVDQLGTVDFMVILQNQDTGELYLADLLDSNQENDCNPSLIPPNLCLETMQGNGLVQLEGEALRSHPDYPLLANCGEVDYWIGLPLSAHGRCLGLIAIKSYSASTDINQFDRELLVYVSNQVAQAIDRLHLQEVLRNKALYDDLTKLPNRALFNDRLAASMARAKREGARLVLMYLDLDRFKWVNDTYGHLAGDMLLKAVSERIARAVRASDTVARIGGDEFVCIFEGDLSDADVDILVSKVVAELCQEVVINGERINVSVSVGTAIYPDDGMSSDEILMAADRLMYANKAQNQDRMARSRIDWSF